MGYPSYLSDTPPSPTQPNISDNTTNQYERKKKMLKTTVYTIQFFVLLALFITTVLRIRYSDMEMNRITVWNIVTSLTVLISTILNIVYLSLY